MNSQVDDFFDSRTTFKDELNLLRQIALDCGLTEQYKWKQPCYTYQNKNLGIVSAFKDYCFISFFKGALLGDTENILHQPGENSQSVRLIKITSVADIKKLERTIRTYIFEAIEIQKAGLKVVSKTPTELGFPEELEVVFKAQPKFEQAFNALTPGRQKAYLLHFTAAKQSKTKIARIEKNMSRILSGFGFNDCTCGHSKRMPNCDGSHKYLK